MRLVSEKWYKSAHRKLEELRKEMKRTDISASMNQAFETYSRLKEEQLWMFVYEKLHDLEDIEEELGIDLVTLFKALKNGCYVKPWAEIKHTYEIRTGSDNIHLFLLDGNDNDYSLKDYGKTWALTKEELL